GETSTEPINYFTLLGPLSQTGLAAGAVYFAFWQLFSRIRRSLQEKDHMGWLLRLTMSFLIIVLAPTQAGAAADPRMAGDSPSATAQKSIASQLAYGYHLLADYDDFIAGDANSAAHFRDKAKQAETGVPVAPDPAPGVDTGNALN